MPDIAWEKFTFSGFAPEELALRRPNWEAPAKHILDLEVSGERVCLVAETGSGKTIMALFVIAKTPGRILFAAPRKHLTEQHRNLADKMSGGLFKCRVIHGESPSNARIWDDEDDDIVFATPETVLNDLARHPNLIGNFLPGRIVADECHHTVSDYAYVELARLARVYRIPILTLTASPGSTPAKINEVVRHWNITRMLWVERPDRPDRFDDIVFVQPDATLRKVDALFNELLMKFSLDLKQAFLAFGYRLEVKHGRVSESELRKAHERLSACVGTRVEYMKARYLAAKYRKLRIAHTRVLTECYETFERYARELEKSHGKAAQAIRATREFKEIRATVRARSLEHPKVQRFIGLQRSMQQMFWQNLTFIYLKETAHHLHRKLSEGCVAAEVVFGGKDRNVKRQNMLLAQLGKGEIESLLSTDVLREGTNVPELKAVIHYAMPKSPIAMIQGNGRVGRTFTGHNVYLALDHPADKVVYYRTLARTKAMERFVRGEEFTAADPAARRVKRRNPAQNHFSFFN